MSDNSFKDSCIIKEDSKETVLVIDKESLVINVNVGEFNRKYYNVDLKNIRSIIVKPIKNIKKSYIFNYFPILGVIVVLIGLLLGILLRNKLESNLSFVFGTGIVLLGFIMIISYYIKKSEIPGTIRGITLVVNERDYNIKLKFNIYNNTIYNNLCNLAATIKDRKGFIDDEMLSLEIEKIND